MLTDALLDELRYKGEGSDLDYKVDRYPFEKGTEDDKSELLKDIIAFANAHREGTAYILMGFRESAPQPAEVVGLPSEGAIDDSRLQEFVNGKLETKLEFRYEERLLGDRHVAVISIPKQQRPFYAKKDYGRVRKEVVYVRRGSATAVASPREIAMMGEANTAKGDVSIDLLFQTNENEDLSESMERAFLVWPSDIPDYAVPQANSYLNVSLGLVNRDYWRQAARHYSCVMGVVHVRLSIKNRSDFSLVDTHVEVSCLGQGEITAELLRSDDVPSKPYTSDLGITPMQTIFETVNRRMRIDERGTAPVAHISLATIRPGQTVHAEQDLAILPSGPGRYFLQVRVMANEIRVPLVFERTFEVRGSVTQVARSDVLKTLKSILKA